MASIYGLVHPQTGELRYIGKADHPLKRLQTHIRDARRKVTPICCWVKKLVENGQKPEMVVLSENCSDWEAEERRLIGKARRDGFRLLNIADGGDQPKCSKEVASRNAKAFNASPMVEYREMMRSFTAAAKGLRGRGCKEKADSMDVAMRKIRAQPIHVRAYVGHLFMERRNAR